MNGNLGLALQGLGAGIRGGGTEFQASLSAQREAELARAEKQRQERLKTFYVDSELALNAIAEGRPERAIQRFSERGDLLAGIPGADPIDTDTMNHLFAIAQSGNPDAGKRIVDTLGAEVAKGRALGYLPQAAKPKEQIVDGQLVTINDGRGAASPIEGFVTESGGEIRKEVRGNIRKGLNQIAKEADVIKTNFNKLKGLTNEISKGNRSAVAQGLVSLVKLGDPGSIVKESEMIAALNEKSPIAAVTELLSGKQTDKGVIDSVVSRIDPLNPNNINVDEVLATANTLVGANVPGIQQRMSEFEENARDNLTELGIKSLFTKGLRKRVGALSDIAQPQSPQSGFKILSVK